MATGNLSTYDLTVGVKLDIEDLIHLLDPFDVPLLGGQGADGRSVLSKGTCFEKKVEWLDETLLTPRTTLNGSHASTATTVSFNTGEALRFQPGDVLLIDDEYIRISTVDYAADTAVVDRSYGTPTAASHADGADVVGVGSAQAEGSDPPDGRAVDRSNRYNLTEIFGPTKIQVTATENVVQKYGLGGTTEFQKQVANRTKEAWIAVEQAVIYGHRAEDTSNGWRTMGGIDDYLTTNVYDASAASITESMLLDRLETCYNAGGNPDRAVMGAKQKRRVSDFDSADIRYGRDEMGRGQIVDWFISDFGQVSMHLNRWVRANEVFIFSRDQAEVVTLRPLVFEPLAKTGDSIKGQIVMEKSFKFYREKHAAKLENLLAS